MRISCLVVHTDKPNIHLPRCIFHARRHKKMERFTTSIEGSLRTGNWFAALFMALALPDICAALEQPTRPVGERYKDWFQRYLRSTYNPSSTYELLETTAPEALKNLPPMVIQSMKATVPPAAAAFTAEDCYRLRCKCLHQGLSERAQADRVHFTAPDRSGRLNVHRNSFNGVLQLSIDQFCRDVVNATLRWWSEVQADAEVAARAKELIRVYALDATELPIVSYGANE